MTSRPSPARLLLTWLLLLALLAATLGAYALELGLALSLAIATLKAAAILREFMELRRAHPTLRLVAAGSLLFLAVLFCLTLADVLGRPGGTGLSQGGSAGAVGAPKSKAEGG
ncbi:MAG: cytochrome C oxidase subunit IV family protein [Planctomycetota bacterium]